MGRPPLPIGSHGRISVRLGRGGTGFDAYANVRDPDGVTRQVQRAGATKAAATRALQAALAERTGSAAGRLSRDSRVSDVAAAWFQHLERQVASEDASPSTLQTYRGAWDRYIGPAVGSLRLGEASVQACDEFLAELAQRRGSSTTKTCKSVLSGMLGFAARRGALPANPVRDTSRVSTTSRRRPRAMTASERAAWLAKLDVDPAAVRADVPALTRMMLATGCRIGEILALDWEDVDLTDGIVQIRWTLIRVAGEGLVRKSTKSDAGERTLRLPSWAVALLHERWMARFKKDPLTSFYGPVFANRDGGHRDPSNTSRAFREARDRAGFEWVTSHVFRKTVATLMHEDGVPDRDISDQLGHSKVSMTQDHYFGRGVVSERTAVALESILMTQ
jgi:integrase